ncbi:MAG: alpha/beta hydrolase [Chloroflexaceae bacterium]|nr:alpha/beta hydrolase [Chloroflexaceae bacterium]
MNNPCQYLFLHGLHSSSQGFKGVFLRNRFPHIRTPDLVGPLDARMTRLMPLLAEASSWIIIGSSFGGLMGTLVARQHPHLVRKLILLAPALTPPFLDEAPTLTGVPAPPDCHSNHHLPWPTGPRCPHRTGPPPGGTPFSQPGIPRRGRRPHAPGNGAGDRLGSSAARPGHSHHPAL